MDRMLENLKALCRRARFNNPPRAPCDIPAELRFANVQAGQEIENDKVFGQEPLLASLLLVVRPGAPSSVLAPSSDALCS